jgi:hypothetical protein
MAEVANRFEMVLAGSSPLPAALPQQATTGTRQMPALPEPVAVPVPEQRRGSPVGRWLALGVPVTAAVVAVALVVAQQLGMVQPVASAAPPTVRSTTSSSGPAAPPPPTSDAADPVSPSGAACSAHYDVMNSWSTGYQAAVTITNLTASQLTGWQVSWRLPGGQRVTSLWNGTFSQQGSVLVVRNASWNAVLAGNTSTSFGLVAGTPGTSPPQPKLTCTTLSQ